MVHIIFLFFSVGLNHSNILDLLSYTINLDNENIHKLMYEHNTNDSRNNIIIFIGVRIERLIIDGAVISDLNFIIVKTMFSGSY